MLAPSLRGYKAAWLGKDISAGLAVAAVGLPSAIAYPAIAGLPPETGLYASIAPLIAYAVFGPSRRLIVGPDAGTMAVLAGVLATIAASVGPDANRVAIAGVIAIAVGLLCILARVLRLGVLASFLSRPILIGFFAGISLSIIVGQISRTTGVRVEGDGLVRPFVELAQRASEIHLPSLILAGGMLALIFLLKAVRSPLPGPVVVVVLSVLLSKLLNFEARGIAIVGQIPRELPSLSFPNPIGLPIGQLVVGAMAVFLVSFGAGIITAKSFGAMDGQKVIPNRELDGFAAADIAAGLFGAFPVTSSDSRTAINFSVGGQSQLTSIFAALALVATILFLGDALRILPIPALGAILVAAAISLIDVAALRELFRISKVEFVFAIIALLGPIGLGVLNGVFLAVAATLVYIIYKSMFPRFAILGTIPGRDGFYKLHHNPAASPEPGLCICLVQGSVLFVNADFVRDHLNEIADNLSDGTTSLVLDAGAITQIDTTAAAMLTDLVGDMKERGIRFGLAELNADVRNMLDRAGVLEQVGADMIFDDVGDALQNHRKTETRLHV